MMTQERWWQFKKLHGGRSLQQLHSSVKTAFSLTASPMLCRVSPRIVLAIQTAKAMNVDKLAEVGAKRPQAEQPSSSSKQAPPETKKAKVEPW